MMTLYFEPLRPIYAPDNGSAYCRKISARPPLMHSLHG